MAGHVVRAEDEIILVEATLARTGRWSRARREKAPFDVLSTRRPAPLGALLIASRFLDGFAHGSAPRVSNRQGRAEGDGARKRASAGAVCSVANEGACLHGGLAGWAEAGAGRSSKAGIGTYLSTPITPKHPRGPQRLEFGCDGARERTASSPSLAVMEPENGSPMRGCYARTGSSAL